MSRLTRSRRAMLVTLCASYAIYCLATMPPGPITAPDSQTYLAFSPIVPVGYPAFLKGIGARGATIVQPLIFSAALAWFGCETLLVTSSLIVAIAVVAASIAIPDLTGYHASILTESLFMSALIAFLASMVRFVRAPTNGAAAAAAIAAGLSATLRSTGYAFLPVLIVMVVQRRPAFARPRVGAATLLAATLPMLALAGGERIAARAIHGDRLLSLSGRHLFAKAALIEAPAQTAPSYRAMRDILDAELDITFAPIRRFIAGAPPETRPLLTLYYESCLQGPCVRQLGDTRAGNEDQRLAEMLGLVGRARIARAPAAFARVAATDYAALWTPFKQRHPNTVAALTALIASSRPLPFEREAFRLTPDASPTFQPSEIARVLQPIVIAIGWFTAGLALLGLAASAVGRPLPDVVAVACLAALTAHAGLLFSATFAAGIGRFTMSLWPAIVTAAIFAAAALFRFAAARRRFVGA